MPRGGYRPGAGRKPSAEPLTEQVAVRVTAQERAELEAGALAADQSVSGYLRHLGLRDARRRARAANR